MQDPDAEDVAKAGRGDRDAAARLIGRHAPKLLTVARRMLASQAEAEDVLQDVFLRLWTHAARWQPGRAKFETWLYRVMLNQCYDRLRRRPTRPLEEAAEVADAAATPDARLGEGQVNREIARALETLPERQKAAILLCHFKECGNIEAAEIMGLDPNALQMLVTFYDMLYDHPVGEHILMPCKNIACFLRGSDQIIEYLSKKLGIKPGETTPDGTFTLQPMECLAACDLAPMMIADGSYYGNLTEERIDEILARLASSTPYRGEPAPEGGATRV